MNDLVNEPDLWLARFPRPARDGHKYDRGHAVIIAADALTGATRLAAEACSRAGVGLVSVLADIRADIYRTALPADIMVSGSPLGDLRNVTAIIAGPGGLPESRRKEVFAVGGDVVRVLDADAIPQPASRSVLDANSILTPHSGEFAKSFPGLEGSRKDKVAEAARLSGAIVVLKGPETLIAAPDGRCVVNKHASPWLAKAGTGDVLAGLIGGLAAQGMAPFDAACAAVWLHGEAGRRAGPGLIAGDLAGHLSAILRKLLAED